MWRKIVAKLTDNNTIPYKVGYYDGMYQGYQACRFTSLQKKALYRIGYKAGKVNKELKRS